MEDLHHGDPRALGPYRLLAVLTEAGGERRYLAHGPHVPGHVEVTLVQSALAHSVDLLRAAEGPGLVAYVDAACDEDPPWLVCRYVPALTLADVRGLLYGGLPEAAVRGIGATLAGALARLHALGAAHGAVTPGGVLLGASGARLVRPRGPGSPADDGAALAAVLHDAAPGRAPDREQLDRCRQPDRELRPSAAELAAHWAAQGSYALPARLVGALAREAEQALEREAGPAGGAGPVGDAGPAGEMGSGEAGPVREPAAEPAAPSAVRVREAALSRRTLLAAAGGLVLGAGAVAGWVLGRGGTEALTSPGARPSPSRTATRVPRGVAPAALWRYDAPSGKPLVRALSLFGGEIGYVPDPPRLTALSLATGEVLWTREDLPDPQRVLPLGGQAVTARSGRLAGLSTRDGKELWTQPVTVMSGQGRLAILNGSAEGRTVIYHAVPEEGGSVETQPPYVVALEVPGRTERWRLKVRTGALGDLVLIAVPGLGDDVHLMERRMPGGARIYRIDGDTGRKRWERVHDWPEGLMSLLDYDPYSEQLLEMYRGRLRAAHVNAGAPQWSLDLYDEPEGEVSRKPDTTLARRIEGVDGPLYFLAGPHQTVHAVDLGTHREHWRHRLPVDLVRDRTTKQIIPPWLSITESGRTLLAAHRLGVVALDPRTGTELWRFAVADGTDGYQVHTAGRLALIVNGPSVYALPVT